MYNIKTFRGTIFCPPIKYSKEFVTSLENMCEGYLPVVRDNEAFTVLPIWRLSSPDEKEVILFNGEKIDLVQVVENKIDDNTAVTNFSERCKTVFSKILEIKGYPCTRIALAPSIIIEKSSGITSLYNRLFNIHKFGEVELDASGVSQVYKFNKKLGAKEIMINHVATFHTESELVTVSGENQIRELYVGDFDINTMVNPDYSFLTDDVKAFFDLAPDSFTAFYKLYFPE